MLDMGIEPNREGGEGTVAPHVAILDRARHASRLDQRW
jgi:hypothetical protein